jgi:hypothetical protein
VGVVEKSEDPVSTGFMFPGMFVFPSTGGEVAWKVLGWFGSLNARSINNDNHKSTTVAYI